MGSCHGTNPILTRVPVTRTCFVHQQKQVCCNAHNLHVPNPYDKTTYRAYVGCFIAVSLGIKSNVFAILEDAKPCFDINDPCWNQTALLCEMSKPLPCFLLDCAPSLLIARRLMQEGANCVFYRTGFVLFLIQLQLRPHLLDDWCLGSYISDAEQLDIGLLRAHVVLAQNSHDIAWNDRLVHEFFLEQLTVFIQTLLRRLFTRVNIPQDIILIVFDYMALDGIVWHKKLYQQLIRRLFQSVLPLKDG